jgi:hypothetical protein
MFVIKSRVATAILLAAAVAGVCASGGTRAAPTDEQVCTKKDDKATEEREKLKGTWVLMTEQSVVCDLRTERRLPKTLCCRTRRDPSNQV